MHFPPPWPQRLLRGRFHAKGLGGLRTLWDVFPFSSFPSVTHNRLGVRSSSPGAFCVQFRHFRPPLIAGI